MAIKGLKEALAKKQARQHPDRQDSQDPDLKITPSQPVKAAGTKPQKKVTGRGR